MAEDESVLYCPYCGESAEEIIEVNDSDPSVGYYAIEMMCPACIRGARLRDCEDAQLYPFTPLFVGWDPAE